MDLDINGKRAFLMASSGGLGLACAVALAKEGVTVTLNGRDPARLKAATDQLRASTGSTAETIVADLSTVNGRETIMQRLIDVDILVTNNAGPPPGALQDWDHAAWTNAFEMNMIPHALLMRHFVPGMRTRRFGRIVNITSAMVKSPRPHMALSTAARAALTAFSKALSLEVARDNVTINNLLPERIDTPRQAFMAQRMVKEQGITVEEARRRIAESIAAKRMGTPEEFARACVMLCSAQSGFISGQNLQIDGGSYPGLM